MIAAQGYPVEVHHVRTADGYLLELHRIPRGRTGPGGGRPVLVVHGILLSSMAWVSNPRRSLGFMLADQGYDVWLGNNRGNRYARRHVTLDPKSRQFWDFTADSQARYDQPAMIDHVLRVTGYEDLFYIGFSHGAWNIWAMLNFLPSYNQKIRLMIGLAPTSTKKYSRGLANVLLPIRTPLVRLLYQLGIYEIPYRQSVVKFAKLFCSKHSPTAMLCALFMFALAGWDPEQLDKSSLPLIYSHVPSGSSISVLDQNLQHVASGEFKMYDYGKKGNLARYGRRRPPLYSLNFVTTPVVLFWGMNDKIAERRDIARLASRLPNLVASQPVRFPAWQHLDFLWGIDADRLVYAHVLRYLSQFGGPDNHRSNHRSNHRRSDRSTPCSAGPDGEVTEDRTQLNRTTRAT